VTGGKLDDVRSVTVAVCTRNRAASLGRCLASLAALEGRGIDLSVLVVDNGSSDSTAAITASWLGRLPNAKYVVEPRPGVSRARNRALERAEGDVVAFLDDDARATPGWVMGLVGAYTPGVAVVGGSVVLEWPGGRRPRWLAPELDRWFSALDLGPPTRPLPADEELFGCNLSVRRDVAVAIGGFDVSQGRIGRGLRSGEDWDLVERARATGATVLYAADAVVVHDVLPERLRPWWLARRSYGQGRGDAARALADRPADGLEAAKAVSRQLARDLPVHLWSVAAGRAAEAGVGLLGASRSLGYAREGLQLALRDRRRAAAGPPRAR
jgi:glycosyltransferase involved in cell wall biosynthesis